jgi:hypothetical protein
MGAAQVELAMVTASSSPSKVATVTNGPKTSSRLTRSSGLARTTVGST